ncbi:MAG: thiol protease/hemagglutinin PrtT [Muribaculaceae bacterium]|nr:thiol protease/hemagglutinin PrtT [Muribaculaceae bacterium]
MKRIALSALFITSLISGLNATPISPADAFGIAGDFLKARGIKTKEITPAASTRSLEGDAPYYIFNIGDDEGFIITAGDDRLPSVIGYSFEGHITPETMPEACVAWLEAHAEAINYLPENPAQKAISYPAFSVEPLLSCRWDQKDPYNRQCPIDNITGRRTVVGCVATAAAQIMDYHKYPVRPEGRIEYEDAAQGITRSFDFSAMAPIDWANITDTYSESSSEEECDAIASLMNAVAHGSQMKFSSGTSMAHNYNAGLALIDYFGYSPEMSYYERALVSDDEWISLITSELQAGRPVLYGGRNPSMGHSFVCDGYDGQGFFHINWGWSGLSDGYYSLSALTPPNQSTGGSDSGYSFSQTILCNIAPKGTPGLHAQEKALLNIDKLYFRDASQFYIATDVDTVTSPLSGAMLFFYSFNKGLKPFSGEVCAAIVDSDGMTPISDVNISNLASQNYTAVQLYLSGASLSDGTYRIGFFYRTSADSEWQPIASSTAGAPSLCTLKVEGDQVAMSAIYPDIRPEITQPLSHSRLYDGSNVEMSFGLGNAGALRLEAYAGVAFMDADGNCVKTFFNPVVCPAADETAVKIDTWFGGIEPGEYSMVPFYTYSSNPAADNIIPLAEPVTVLVEGLLIFPTEGSYFIMNPEKPYFEVKATNRLALDWSAPVAVEITQNGTVIARLPEAEMALSSSATSTFTFDCSDLTLKRASYQVSFIIPDEKPVVIAEYPLVVTADISSVGAIEADGIVVSTAGDITVSSPEALASCALYDTAGRLAAEIRPNGTQAEIPASGLPAGIYILRITTESGQTATRKLRL